MSISKPYLSVVAVSRNDDHGGDPLVRTQIFINSFVEQCNRFELEAELIIVDWNPVEDRPGLQLALSFPKVNTFVRGLVITVPKVLHEQLKCAGQLNLFQMIGKNVGIRRSTGSFVLATNIDILFSDELIKYISQKQLLVNRYYRVDRFDIDSEIKPNMTPKAIRELTKNNIIRKNIRFEPKKFVNDFYSGSKSPYEQHPEEIYFSKYKEINLKRDQGVSYIEVNDKVPVEFLHTNACGDFTLMSKEAWEFIRGYPEFESFSMNIDSMGILAAHYGGIKEIALLPPCVCFHIEHSIGSGWSPEGEALLYQKLMHKKITNPQWPELMPIVDEMKALDGVLHLNNENWGLELFNLPICSFGESESSNHPYLDEIIFKSRFYRVGAIKPNYDLDYISLHSPGKNFEINQLRELNKSKLINRMEIFWPNEVGEYCEESKSSYTYEVGSNTQFKLRIPSFDVKFPIRIDPCDFIGMIEFFEVIIMSGDGVTLLNLQKNKLSKFINPIKDLQLLKSSNTLKLFSTGNDPQLEVYLPAKNFKEAFIFIRASIS